MVLRQREGLAPGTFGGQNAAARLVTADAWKQTWEQFTGRVGTGGVGTGGVGTEVKVVEERFVKRNAKTPS